MGQRLIDFIDRQFRDHWKTSLSELSLADWVRDLSGFTLVQIEQAFSEHRKNSVYRPRAKDIREFIFNKLPRTNESINPVSGKCYVESCINIDVERCSYSPAILMCRFHHDEYILKLHSDSIEAEVIKRSRKFEEEAKKLGMTNKQYFENLNPGRSVMIKNSMRVTAGKKEEEHETKHVVNY